MLTLDRKITFGDVPVRYTGKVERCCIVFFPGEDGIALTLGDTMRCAREIEACKRTLENLASIRKSDEDHAAGFAQLMHSHCKALTRWVAKPTRDVQRVLAVSRRQYR
jgi:hypothetical protein